MKFMDIKIFETFKARKLSIILLKTGLPFSGIKGLGSISVKGFILKPLPPAIMTALKLINFFEIFEGFILDKEDWCIIFFIVLFLFNKGIAFKL